MSDCRTIRRILVRHGTMNMAGDSDSAPMREEWVTRACGTPLFSPEERRSQTCRSCAAGWTHPENYPVKGDQP